MLAEIPFHGTCFLVLSYRLSSRFHSFSFWRLAIWSPSLCFLWCYHIARPLVQAGFACGAAWWLSAPVVFCWLTCEAVRHTVSLMLELTYNLAKDLTRALLSRQVSGEDSCVIAQNIIWLLLVQVGIIDVDVHLKLQKCVTCSKVFWRWVCKIQIRNRKWGEKVKNTGSMEHGIACPSLQTVSLQGSQNR